MFYKTNNNVLLEPVFLYNRQYFATRTLFYSYVKNFGFEGLPIFNNRVKKTFHKNNLFLITKIRSVDNLKYLELVDDDTKNLFLLKNIIKNDNKFFKNIIIPELNFSVNLNIFLEYYKIIILILIKINKKYI